jgi:hypothetical protein
MAYGNTGTALTVVQFINITVLTLHGNNRAMWPMLDLFSPIAVLLDAFEGPLFIFKVEQDSVGELSARCRQHKKTNQGRIRSKSPKITQTFLTSFPSGC